MKAKSSRPWSAPAPASAWCRRRRALPRARTPPGCAVDGWRVALELELRIRRHRRRRYASRVAHARSTRSSTPVLKVRTVPLDLAAVGHDMVASPAWIGDRDHGAVSIGLTRCARRWSGRPAPAGGRRNGVEHPAWQRGRPAGRIVIRNSLLDAITRAGRLAPAGMPPVVQAEHGSSTGQRSNRPSATISRAPPPPSSAGWNTSTTPSRSSRRRASRVTVANGIATWPS